MAKRMTAKSKASREAAAERMRLIWEARKKISEFPKKEVASILQKVYLAGWHHDKHDFFPLADMMSVSQATDEIEKLFQT